MMPVIFAAHGAPILLDDDVWMGELASAEAPRRGLDHGAYVPLVAMYPAADIPVLQLSMPGLDARALYRLGQALAPLRDEGVLIAGSGFLTHNMRFAFRPGIPSWAREFDDWAAEALSRFDVDALVDVQQRAPAAALAHPTWEHCAPLLVAAGAASDSRPQVRFPIEGFWMQGAFSRRPCNLDNHAGVFFSHAARPTRYPRCPSAPCCWRFPREARG